MGRPDVDSSALEEAARQAARHSYSPYSRFAVGAAVLTEGGDIVAGCNVENASLGLSVCAERNAVFAAAARGARRIVALTIYTPTETPILPCGACLQVLQEFAPQASVTCVCEGKERIETTLAELLPRPFATGHLHRREENGR